MTKKKVKRKITKAMLAKEAEVSRPAITKLCAGSLKPAMIGVYVDVDHPLVIKYLKSKQKSKTKVTPKKEKESKKKPEKKKSVNPEKSVNPKEESHYSKDRDTAGIMDLTLRDILKKHGTDLGFKTWIDACKVLAEIEHKDLKIKALKEDLIPKEWVKMHIFGAIENSNLRLLTDFPKTLVPRLFALFKSKGTTEEGEELTRSLITPQLKGVKATAIRILKKND